MLDRCGRRIRDHGNDAFVALVARLQRTQEDLADRDRLGEPVFEVARALAAEPPAKARHGRLADLGPCCEVGDRRLQRQVGVVEDQPRQPAVRLRAGAGALVEAGEDVDDVPHGRMRVQFGCKPPLTFDS